MDCSFELSGIRIHAMKSCADINQKHVQEFVIFNRTKSKTENEIDYLHLINLDRKNLCTQQKSVK